MKKIFDETYILNVKIHCLKFPLIKVMLKWKKKTKNCTRNCILNNNFFCFLGRKRIQRFKINYINFNNYLFA